jgi:4-hydroxy 2-oxovalerate aldolase
MNNTIELLDCTLRDGGHVNKANFGKDAIHSIVESLVNSNLDYIELGFLRDGSFTSDESNYSKIEDAIKNIDLNTKKKQKYSVMIRPDWYDITQLAPCDGTVEFIRFAFYLKDIELTKKYCQYVSERGYKFILNPVNIMGYDPETLDSLLDIVNAIHPYGVTIVDTFGSIQRRDLIRLYEKYEEKLDKDIVIGLHLHENMASAFLLAQLFIDIKKPERKAIIDASLLGMGRIPGNLCIEMMLDYMNTEYGKNYNLKPTLSAISKYIEPIKQVIPWGYSPVYYFSGKEIIHRSYAEYFINKGMPLDDILNIFEDLKSKPEKLNYSKQYAESLYVSYMEKEQKNEN